MVYKLPTMVDMARTPKDVADDMAGMPVPVGMLHDRYPCGLSISLDHHDLEKLDLDEECEIGDMLHLFCFGKVTGVSKHQGMNGDDCCRIEIQLTHIGLEDEDEENREADRNEEGEESGEERGAFGGKGY